MATVSAEALLVSALLNNHAVGDETAYGISEALFLGYHEQYVWLLSYVANYGEQPSIEAFCHAFPDFPVYDHGNIRSACDAVHEEANRRRVVAGIQDAMELVRLGQTGAAYERMVASAPLRAAAKPKSILTDTAHLDEWRGKPYCVEVPYPTLQRHTGGIRAGNLWYLAGRPGQGKTAHLGSLAQHAVLTSNRVLFYSLEMSEEEVRARFHAGMARRLGYSDITMSRLLSHDVDLGLYKELHGAIADKLEQVGGVLDVHTPADGPVSPATVAARAGEYDLTIIDYITLMKSDAGVGAFSDWRVVTEISNSLKTIALSENARLVCAAQINRDGETGSAPPKVKNLAQSDALGQDGDVVLTMRAKPHNVATHFSLEKNRHGPSDIQFFTTFEPNTGSFIEVTEDHVVDLEIDWEDHQPRNDRREVSTLHIVRNEDS